jgi:2,4-dienoyl-CoA reductase-like NADH-dependent reductase (Old Yellow Enzyme family)/thioredoxin reductase
LKEVALTLTHVFTPLRINGCEIRNRIVRAAHATNLGNGTITDELIEYHYVRGRGGVGLSIVEIAGVHCSSPAAINLFAPGIADRFTKLVERVRPTGMKLFQQIWHGGHNCAPIDGSPPWSSSDTPGFLLNQPAIPMTKAMIDDIVGAYADAARACEEWGLDGVEVHAAHGYLPAQFLSSALNKREDDYGGPFENRVRFLNEVMVAVRGAVSKDFAIGMRVAPEDMVGGVDVAETLRAAQLIESQGLIDYINISQGNYQRFAKMIGGMHEPVGYEMPQSAPISAQLTVPAIVTGRFRTLEEADQVIRAGEAAMVSCVRALIADPDLVAKTAAGHHDQVRPCIACNQGCLGQVVEPPFRMGCAVNPAVGFEAELAEQVLRPVAEVKRILVVGGGPAGMEAARVAALRGHRVSLAEAAPLLGGALLLAAKAPTRHGMVDLAAWLQNEIYRLGVDVRLSTYIDVEDVTLEEWDAVIVATGSTPRLDGVQNSNPGEPTKGMAQAHVLSSIDLMTGARSDFGKFAVVIDDLGHYEALACAEYLADRGVSVAFVTRHVSVAPRVEGAQMVEPALTRLSARNFTAHLRSRAIEISTDAVTVGPTFLPANTNQIQTLPADTVVFVSPNHANRELHTLLVERGVTSYVIGDANAARHLPTAIREGRIAGITV